VLYPRAIILARARLETRHSIACGISWNGRDDMVESGLNSVPTTDNMIPAHPQALLRR